MRNFVSDTRYGLRLLVKSPGLFAAAVLALALGIGANTAIFSVVYTVLLRPLPVRELERLVAFQHRNAERDITLPVSGYSDMVEWRRTLKSYEEFAGVQHVSMNLADENQPERVMAGKVTATFFPLLGIQPVLGRNFVTEEDRPGAGRAVILTDQLWRRRFGAKADVIGASLKLNGDPYTVVGVLPKEFRFVGEPEDLYIPLAGNPVFGQPVTSATVYARLRRGVAKQQAEAELVPATAAMVARIPPYKGFALQLVPVKNWTVNDVRTSLYVLLGAVALILLIACANVASLLISRATARREEIAVRAALGASRGQLIRQLLAESVPLALIGAAAGLLVAFWCIKLIPLIDLSRISRIDETKIDLTVLFYAAAASMLACLLFGLVPAVSLSRVSVHDAMKDGARTGSPSTRLRSILVAAEIALTLVLSVGAVLMVKTLSKLSAVDPGFDASNTLTASIDLPREKLKSRDQVFQFCRQLRERLGAVPGVESITIVDNLPLGGNYKKGDFHVEGRNYANPGEIPILWHRTVDFGYAKTLRIPLLAGRFFTSDDRDGAAKVVVVNESAARRLWGNENPIGRQVSYGGDAENLMTVVGVTSEVKLMDVTLGRDAEVLLPFEQYPMAAMHVAVRVDPRIYPDPMRAAPLLRQVVAQIDPNQAVAKTISYSKIISDRLGPRRVSMILLGSFAGLALLLSAIGVYGLLSFSVARRTHELGVRMALGARAQDVVGMVMREALLWTALGLAAGVAAAAAMSRLIRSLLFEVSASDLAAYGISALLLFAVAAIAAYIPARRATRVDPVMALRYE